MAYTTSLTDHIKTQKRRMCETTFKETNLVNRETERPKLWEIIAGILNDV